jgi:predicted dehydrogenase
VDDIGVAIVGYGLSGRLFHAALIAATPGLRIDSVVTSSEDRRRQVTAEHPGARVLDSVPDLWRSASPGLVVVATPNDSHVAIASAALERGIPVVVDKPLAITADDAQALVAQAQQRGVLLTVFQNRRWDTDQLTLRRLMAEGALGAVTRYESRFERWRPDPDPAKWREQRPPGQGGGVLLDLGTHLVDQALVLFGPVSHVYGEVDARRGTAGDDDVFIALRHISGTLSHLWASAVTAAPGPRLRVQGTAGGLVVPALDPQEAALRAGERPTDRDRWGRSPEWERPRLVAGERSVPVPPEPGDWTRFYELLRVALNEGGPPPVDPGDAVTTLRLLEAARESDHTRAVMAVTGSAREDRGPEHDDSGDSERDSAA